MNIPIILGRLYDPADGVWPDLAETRRRSNLAWETTDGVIPR